jgi:hypothetical protein
MKKEIHFWEVKVRFLIRKDNLEGLTRKEIIEKTNRGIGGNDMDGIPVEDIRVEVL